MQKNRNVNSLRQFRFSLRSLLYLITAIVACLAVLRVQQQLVASQHFSDVAGNVLGSAVLSDASRWLFALQLVGLTLGMIVVFILRMPNALRIYVFGQSIWVSVAVIGFVFQNASWLEWLWQPFLAVYLCEPACALVFACGALLSALWHRLATKAITAGAIVAIGLVVELFVVLEVGAYGAALSGAIGR